MTHRFSGIREWFRPHHIVERLCDLDYEMLAARGIRGVILDLDNTLAPWRIPDQIFPGVEEWLNGLRASGMRACMVTNAMHHTRVLPVAERLGLPWVGRAMKPLPGGFRRGMRLLETTPASTAMIGDLLTVDICGANTLGLFTVLVEPLSDYEAWPTRLVQRPLERLIGRVPRRGNG